MPVQEQSLDGLSTDHLQSDLRGRSVRGGVLNVTSQGAQFLIQSVATIVLARLLTPSDFGLVAMVSTVTGLGQAFADLGLSEATIQRKEISHNQVSALFWINVTIGLGLMTITLISAPILARFYREPRLVNITLLVSLTFLFGGLRVQPDAILKRQMRFAALAIRDVASYAVAVPIAIFMAWRGASYWALVALPLILNFNVMTLSWLMIKWRPSLPRRDAQVGSMIAFGGNVAVSQYGLLLTPSFNGHAVDRSTRSYCSRHRFIRYEQSVQHVWSRRSSACDPKRNSVRPRSAPQFENVLQESISPLFRPGLSHCWRIADEPWVKLSGTA